MSLELLGMGLEVSELVAYFGKNLGAGEVLYEHIVGGDAYAEVAGKAQVGAGTDVDSEARFACGHVVGFRGVVVEIPAGIVEPGVGIDFKQLRRVEGDMGVEVERKGVFPFVTEDVVGARRQTEVPGKTVGELEAGKSRCVVSGKSGGEADGFLTLHWSCGCCARGCRP